MADQPQWVTFNSSNSDSDEALSLSDLPISKPNTNNPEQDSGPSPSKDDQFEFRIITNGNHSSTNLTDMCAADDVFFHGQLLPLGPTHPVSRSDSTASISFDSSTSVSRSLSSNSCASSSDAPQSLLRIRSNTLCACPSPNPRVWSVGRNGCGRRSTGSAPPVGWGLLRLGVAMAPEMELSDMRVRLARGGSGKNLEKRGNAVWRLLGGGLMGCKCSPEDAILGKDLKARKKGEGRGRVAGLERKERMFEWLEELSLAKEPLMKFNL
ncbi:uncharacterized protein LOC110024530 [Phalaenopsis equestris]|uniref:uncharacterized protein LOC110024530 n=1 Tax=Phalaenopsis equestris TaxID=78828 RepID=UPI0009E292AF|nr:uncharacterized protein LOC110024530 [Phalaenopsis equestris]